MIDGSTPLPDVSRSNDPGHIWVHVIASMLLCEAHNKANKGWPRSISLDALFALIDAIGRLPRPELSRCFNKVVVESWKQDHGRTRRAPAKMDRTLSVVHWDPMAMELFAITDSVAPWRGHF